METPRGDAVAELAPLPAGLYCPDCAYDLRGSRSPRCPECGFDLEVVRAGESQIPWVHRGGLGRGRAYARTVWRVTFGIGRLADEMAHRVAYGDAQRFRWVTIGVAYVGLLAMKASCVWGAGGGLDEVTGEMPWLAIPVEIATVLTLAAWTGLPSYFFHPRGAPLARQNRAVALSYYACGPLAWLLPGAIVPALLLLTESPIAAAVAAVLLVVLLLVVWWHGVNTLARLVFRSTGRTVLVAAMMPPLWLVVGALIMVGVPAITLFVVIVFLTWP
jgi:hypothetical protein